MVFSTAIFLTLFLPLVLLGCWALGGLCHAGARRTGNEMAWRPVNALILLASFLFYFWGEGLGVAWLVASVLFNAGCARILARRESPRWRQGWLAAAVAGNLLFLGWFKYAGFIARSANLLPGVDIPVPEVALPLGISFYTFQAMSYVVDVYRRETKPSASVVDFACYVTMFPQLVAGPIVRYVDVAERLLQRRVTLEGVASGFRRFLGGLAKKVLLANTVALMADAVWGVIAGGHGVAASMAWIGLVCYALQIYYDFSGYSDMAIGMGRMLGFEFKENFLHPYCATSARDFWRRWHVSLSTWFRDYVYIPLGGNRRGLARTCLNSLVVFALCGLWHGASAMFLLWGIWHGLFLTLERLAALRGAGGAPRKESRTFAGTALRQVVANAYALAVALFGWVLFRSETLADAGLMLRSLSGLADVSREARAIWLDFNPKQIVAIVAGVALAYPVVPWLRAALGRRLAQAQRSGAALRLTVYAGECALLTALGLLSLLFVAGGSYNPFLYFRF